MSGEPFGSVNTYPVFFETKRYSSYRTSCPPYDCYAAWVFGLVTGTKPGRQRGRYSLGSAVCLYSPAASSWTPFHSCAERIWIYAL